MILWHIFKEHIAIKLPRNYYELHLLFQLFTPLDRLYFSIHILQSKTISVPCIFFWNPNISQISTFTMHIVTSSSGWTEGAAQ